jgi:uncharacterized heparinase superfamily protein
LLLEFPRLLLPNIFLAVKRPRLFQKGLQLASGNFLIEGRLIRDPDEPIWDVEPENTTFQKKAHGFFWLDHLVANGSADCAAVARLWFAKWLEHFGNGDNLAWTPELAGARIIRLINHAIILLVNTTKRDQNDFFMSVSHHARFLKKRWHYAPEGLPRFQALVGYVYSALALEEFKKDLKPALRALGKECENYIDADGGIPTRNPEELLDILTLLVWVVQGLTSASLTPNRALLCAIERIRPAIRTLQLGDGKLVEFHGGRAATKKRIDQVLMDSGARSSSTLNNAMGYSRIAKANSLLIVDTGGRPNIEADGAGYECALGFEFSYAQHPIFQSLGTGQDLNYQRRKASYRADGFTVATLQPFFSDEAGRAPKLSTMMALDAKVMVLQSAGMHDGAAMLMAAHTGYRQGFGLTYSRKLELTRNGCVLTGTDRFYCEGKQDQAVLDTATKYQIEHRTPIATKFHIAPDVDAQLDLGGTAVSLQLPDNTVWIFKASGGTISLQDSAYYTSERLKPRATKQIVVTFDVVNYEGEITWMLTCLDG